jgi:hypothetical protein
VASRWGRCPEIDPEGRYCGREVGHVGPHRVVFTDREAEGRRLSGATFVILMIAGVLVIIGIVFGIVLFLTVLQYG